MEDAGAAAVVLHSLFEEQVEGDASGHEPKFRIPPDVYLKHIAEAKSCTKIPIIASLNCTTLGGWISYARQITEAGADALELNIYKISTRPEVTGSTVESGYIDVVRTVRAATAVPLAVKLSPYFSNFANMAAAFDALGADALVLFNRFYQPDIDLEKMEVTPNLMLSSPIDMRLPLRVDRHPLWKNPRKPCRHQRNSSVGRCHQACNGRRGRNHALQRSDAPRNRTDSANRERDCRAAQIRIVRPDQRYHEPKELPGSKCFRTRAIRPRSLDPPASFFRARLIQAGLLSPSNG